MNRVPTEGLGAGFPRLPLGYMLDAFLHSHLVATANIIQHRSVRELQLDDRDEWLGFVVLLELNNNSWLGLTLRSWLQLVLAWIFIAIERNVVQVDCLRFRDGSVSGE